MIANKMQDLLATQVVSLVNSSGTAKVGLGGNSTFPTQTDLDIPISGATTTVVATKSDENVVQVKITVAGSSISGKVIREVGVFDSSNNMLLRQNFTGIGPFSSTTTVEIFIFLEVE